MNKKAVVEEERILTPEEELEMLRKENAELKETKSTLEAKIIDQETIIDEVKKKEEGWLIICNNPLYQGSAYGVTFTDGVAFIPKLKVYPRFVVQPYTEDQKQAILDDKVRHPHAEKELAEYERTAAILSSQRLVMTLVSDFGYTAEFFTKDQMDELQKKISARAMERKEIQAKLDKEPSFLEKLSIPQRM